MRHTVVAPVRSLLRELGYIAPSWCEALNEDLVRELAMLERELGALDGWMATDARRDGDNRWSKG